MDDKERRKVIAFATEIRLLEKKYNLQLSGNRVGDIKICNSYGEPLRSLSTIILKTPEGEEND